MATFVDDAAYKRYLEARNLSGEGYTTMELLAIAAAREIPDRAYAFAGTGLPLIGTMAAQQLQAPRLTLILEAGSVGPVVEHIPIAVSDPRGCLKATTVSSMIDAFGTTALRGWITFGILGGAEMDMYGNINSTVIGDYWPAGVSGNKQGPKVRLTGSGGANNIAALADILLAMFVQEERRFPRKAGYITTVAGLRGPKGETRYDYGLFRGGRLAVASDLGIFRNDTEDGRLRLDVYYPGVEVKDIVDNTGWEIDPGAAKVMAPPTYDELKVLRLIVDPTRIYLGRKSKRELAREAAAAKK
jgi:glutaconate CoA-transferase subunit B